MKQLYLTLCVLFMVGCAGVLERGPNGEPSPVAEGVQAGAEAYDESAWAAFGPWGAAVAGVIAAAVGIRKGVSVYKARKQPQP